MFFHWDSAELGERLFHITQFKCIRPVRFMRRAEYPEYLEDLIDFTVAHEQRSLLKHLCKNAACAPQVDSEGIMFRAQKNFWAAIPQSDNFMSISLYWEAKCSRKTKVSKFDCLSIWADEQILWFAISVEYPVWVEENERLENLIQEALTLCRRQSLSNFLHVLLKIKFKPFED